MNAIDKIYGGYKKFVVGKWKPGYELGTYGVDPSSKTAWAVINYTSWKHSPTQGGFPTDLARIPLLEFVFDKPAFSANLKKLYDVKAKAAERQ